MDLDSVSVHKHVKKELGQYPAILISRGFNNPYILRFKIFRMIKVKMNYSCMLELTERK